MLREFALWSIVLALAARFAYRAFLHRTTPLLDLDDLDAPPLNKPRLAGQAVVIGGSMSGLLTARVLSDHYESVLILDDEFGDTGGTSQPYERHNVWQWPYLHIVAVLAVQIFNRLFPGFTSEAKKRGGRIFPISQARMHEDGKPIQCWDDPKLDNLCMSRGGIEATVRSFVMRIPNVRVLHAKAIDAELCHGRYTSVSYRMMAKTSSAKVYTEDAAFVADCSGNARLGVKLQKRLGDSHVPRNSAYISHTTESLFVWDLTDEQWRSLPLPTPPDETSWIVLWNAAANDERGDLAVSRTDPGNRLNVHITSHDDKPTPPQSVNELLDVCAALSLPTWLNELLHAVAEIPLTRLHRQRMPVYDRDHYEEVHVPANFISVGDAICRLNPAFGQGTTIVAIHACTVNSLLRQERKKGRSTLPSDFGDKAMRLMIGRTIGAEEVNKLFDYAWDCVEPAEGERLHRDNGGPPLELRLFSAVLEAAKRDAIVGNAFFGLMAQTDTPLSLLQPHIMGRIIYQTARRWLAGK